MDVQFRAGQLTGLHCPKPQCSHAEVWVVSIRDWERSGRILLHCRNGHLLAWQAQMAAQAGEQHSA